jgi:hypothetical protein
MPMAGRTVGRRRQGRSDARRELTQTPQRWNRRRLLEEPSRSAARRRSSTPLAGSNGDGTTRPDQRSVARAGVPSSKALAMARATIHRLARPKDKREEDGGRRRATTLSADEPGDSGAAWPGCPISHDLAVPLPAVPLQLGRSSCVAGLARYVHELGARGPQTLGQPRAAASHSLVGLRKLTYCLPALRSSSCLSWADSSKCFFISCLRWCPGPESNQ